MNREQLTERSVAYLQRLLSQHLPGGTRVFLFGSRARGDQRWNSDFDLWIDGEVSDGLLSETMGEIDESFVPFRVDMVTTPRLKGPFGEAVRREAKRWAGSI